MKKIASIRAAVTMGLILAATAWPPTPAGARGKSTRPEQTSVGRVSVIDGDTLELHALRIRLAAMDAPEARQSCRRDGRQWPCGRSAAFALADLIGTRPVTCSWRTLDRYRRPVAKCTVGGTDLGGWMVDQGWALAFRRYGLDYAAEERSAREGRRGIWAGSFVPPWAFRTRRGEEVSAQSYAGA